MRRERNVNLLLILIISGLKIFIFYWFYSESNVTSNPLRIIGNVQVSEQDCSKF